MSDIKTIIGEARRPERTVTVCLRPDLLADWQRAAEELQRVREAPRTSLDDAGPVALAQKVNDFERQMREASIEFVVRGLPPAKVRELQADSDDDETLALDVLRASLVEPDLDDDDWTRLFGDDGALTLGEVGRLAEASNAVNFRSASVPSSRLASAVLASSDEN